MARNASIGIIALVLWIAPSGLAQDLIVTAVQNAASRDGRLSPGVLARISARNLWCVNRVCGADLDTLAVTALFDDRPGRVQTVGYDTAIPDEYFTVQIPAELAPGPAKVVIYRRGQPLVGPGASPPFDITLDALAPGLFTLDGSGTGQGHFRRQPIQPPLQFSVRGSVLLFTLQRASFPDLLIDDTRTRAVPGEILVADSVGLGPTNPSVTPAPTVNTPRLSVGGRQAEILWAGRGGEDSFGRVDDWRYEVRFRVPPDLPEGRHVATLEIGGRTSNSVTLSVGRRAPVITSFVNGASFLGEGRASPGSIMTVFSENLEARDQLAGFPATEFQGVSVSFDGTLTALFHLIASRKQLNLITPSELPEGGRTVAVHLKTPLGTSPRYYLWMGPAVPGLFLIPDPSNTSRRNVAALFANSAWLVTPPSLASALNIPDDCKGRALAPTAICGQPASPGDTIQIYATGLGRATPGGDPRGLPLPTGSTAPRDGNPLYVTVARPAVRIGGVPAEVQFSGLAPGFAGLHQINVRIPNTAPTGDDVPVTVDIPVPAGFPEARSAATLAIQR